MKGGEKLEILKSIMVVFFKFKDINRIKTSVYYFRKFSLHVRFT